MTASWEIREGGRVMTGMGLVVGSVWASTHRQDVKAGVRQHRVVERVGTDRWQGGYVILRSWENGSRGRSSTVRVVERSAGWMIPGHRLVEEPDA